MKPVILFRTSSGQAYELPAARKYFDVVESRCQCENNLVISRYASLPYHQELEDDLAYRSSKLINSTEQHNWIANFEWYDELWGFTPKSWTEDNFYRCDDPGPFIVKGMTNSKKKDWDTLMFAKDKRTAIEIGIKLREDSLLSYQKLVYRKYVPLVTHEVGVNGQRFADEWRFFFLGNKYIAHGYYWSQEEHAEHRIIEREGIELAQKCADIASRHANFFVLDMAKTEAGGWTLIEVNDGTSSGLSMIDPELFYARLSSVIEGFFSDAKNIFRS